MADGLFDRAVPDEADAAVASDGNPPVGELRHNAAAVSRALRASVDAKLAAFIRLHQPPAVGADPEVVPRIPEQAADAKPFQPLAQLILHRGGTGPVHHIQAAVRAEVQLSLPGFRRVDHPVLHAEREVDITEGGFRQAQQAEPGGGKPQVSLIVHQHVVNGVVKLVGVDAVIAPLAVQHGNAVVGGDEHFPSVCKIQIVDAREPVTADFPDQGKVVAGDTVKKQSVAAGTGYQAARPVKAAAFEDFSVRPAK